MFFARTPKITTVSIDIKVSRFFDMKESIINNIYLSCNIQCIGIFFVSDKSASFGLVSRGALVIELYRANCVKNIH